MQSQTHDSLLQTCNLQARLLVEHCTAAGILNLLLFGVLACNLQLINGEGGTTNIDSNNTGNLLIGYQGKSERGWSIMIITLEIQKQQP